MLDDSASFRKLEKQMTSCPLCKSQCKGRHFGTFGDQYSCDYCGDFVLDRRAKINYQSQQDVWEKAASVAMEARLSKHDFPFALVSGDTPSVLFFSDVNACNGSNADLMNQYNLRLLGAKAIDQTEQGFTAIDIEKFIESYPKTSYEIIIHGFLNISRIPKHPVNIINYSDIQNPMIFANDDKQKTYLLDIYNKNGWIQLPKKDYTCFRISLKGWEFVNEYTKDQIIETKQGFVAMWFDESRNAYYDQAIAPAIKSAGFAPMIIRNKEHNNDIKDEILGEIRRSRFLVADFTGNRGGIYFEAGFAMGLGIPVIWLMDERWVNAKDGVKDGEDRRIHFDTNHFNYLFYNSLPTLKRDLENRIRATIPLS